MTDAELSPIDYKALLGDELTRLRQQAGKTRVDVAEALGCSESKIGSFERGRSAVNPSELRTLMALFDVPDVDRPSLEQLATEARRRAPRTPYGSAIPDRLKRFFRVEETARRIRCYRVEYLHGLVQTEDYARAQLSENPMLRRPDVERLLQARMARQARLTGPRPVEISLMMPESAFALPVGGSEVARAQLLHLVELAGRPNVEIRMLPTSAGERHGRGVTFSILTPAAAQRKTVVYLENLTDGEWVDDQDRVDHYIAAYEHLLAAALSVEDTVKALATVAAEL